MCLPQVSPTDQAVAAPLPAGGLPHSTHGENLEASVTISTWNWRPEHTVRQGQAGHICCFHYNANGDVGDCLKKK